MLRQVSELRDDHAWRRSSAQTSLYPRLWPRICDSGMLRDQITYPATACFIYLVQDRIISASPHLSSRTLRGPQGELSPIIYIDIQIGAFRFPRQKTCCSHRKLRLIVDKLSLCPENLHLTSKLDIKSHCHGLYSLRRSAIACVSMNHSMDGSSLDTCHKPDGFSESADTRRGI